MTNDIYSNEFESKMDPFFTSEVKKHRGETSWERWERNVARSALATKRPRPSTRYWCKGQLGVSSPAKKDK